MTLPDGAQSGTRKDLANYRLQCAEQELKDTQHLIHAESFNSANNRSYYAIFHAINAIHALDGNGYKRHTAGRDGGRGADGHGAVRALDGQSGDGAGYAAA